MVETLGLSGYRAPDTGPLFSSALKQVVASSESNTTIEAALIALCATVASVLLTQLFSYLGRRADHRREEQRESKATRTESERRDREIEQSLAQFTDDRLKFMVTMLMDERKDLQRRLDEAYRKDEQVHRELQSSQAELQLLKEQLRQSARHLHKSATVVESKVDKADETLRSNLSQDQDDDTP